MQRPLVNWFLSSVSGLVIAYYLPLAKDLLIIIAIIILVISVIIMLIKIKTKTHILILLLIFLISFFYLQFEKLSWKQAELKKLLGQKIKFSAIVDKVEVEKNKNTYIVEKLKAIKSKQEYKHKIMLVNWNDKSRLDLGDKIIFTTKLELASLQKNPGGFSYRDYLQKKGIYAIGEIKKESIIKVSDSKNFYIIFINRIRNKIKELIKSYFRGANQKIINALLLGEKNAVPAKIDKSFKQLGVSHLLVVSGFHIGLISYFLYSIINYFAVPDFFSLIVVTLVLICYLAIINWQLSALRATLLILLVLIAKKLNKKIDLYNLLSGVALILLVINPWSLFTISFQLSFSAVVMINYLSPIIEKHLTFLANEIRSIISATIAVQIGLIPILIYYFNQISLSTLIANLLLTPLISIVLFLAVIFLGLSLINCYCAKIVVLLINFLLFLSIEIVEFLVNNLNFILIVKQPSIMLIIMYYIIIFYFAKLTREEKFFYSNNNYKKIMIVFLTIIIIVTTFGFKQNNNLEIVFLDVGLGDSIYMNTPSNRNILIDAGVEGIEVINFLKNRGISRLDLIFISHFHNDHVGGIIEVIKRFKVDRICYPPTVNNELKNKLEKIIREKNSKVNISVLTTGDNVIINHLNFLVLSPKQQQPLFKKSVLNNNSLVLKLTYKQFQLLLTGDIEKEAEKRLVEQQIDLDVDVLKLAHHGSKTSSTRVFLKQAAPDLSIMLVGANNHGLPNDEILNRLKELEIKNFRTDKEGAIILKTDGRSYNYKTFLD